MDVVRVRAEAATYVNGSHPRTHRANALAAVDVDAHGDAGPLHRAQADGAVHLGVAAIRTAGTMIEIAVTTTSTSSSAAEVRSVACCTCHAVACHKESAGNVCAQKARL